MALRVLQFQSIIPAGTPSTAPVTLPLGIDNWQLEQIDLEVPAGPAGLMGFAVFNNGVQWIPFTPGAWLIWDDAMQSWPMVDQPNASGWAIVGYNTGVYDHPVTSRLHVNLPDSQSQQQLPPVVTFVSSDAPASPAVTL
jgi:hypothetical protein